MNKAIKVVVATVAASTLFSAVFSILPYFFGLYHNGVNLYGWDAYWPVFIGAEITILGMALLAAIVIAIFDWALGN